MNIQVKRQGIDTVELPLNESTFTKKVMGEHNLAFSIVSVTKLDLRIGDTLTYKGELLTINQEPSLKRNHLYQYDVIFEGHRHTLSRFILKDEGAFTFTYTGKPNDFMFMFLDCVNGVDPGWTAGEVEDLEDVTIDFDKNDCLSALSMIAQAFDAEWDIKGKVISLKKTVGVAKDFPVSYGMGNGLYSLTRQSINDKVIVTRAYAVGGDKNLPEGVIGNLKLNDYIEKNVDLYGIREGIFEDEEIYPHRTGTATAVSQSNAELFTLTDTSLDFDLNGQLISGESGKIVFKSGSLNGNEFDISSYNHATKTIRYKANKDSNGNFFPFGVTVAEIGDKYTLVGIRMPQSDIDSAYAELTAGRLKYLNDNSAPRVVYDLELDLLELKRRETLPDAGDIIPVSDSELGIGENIRVTSVSYPGHYPDVLESGMTFTAEVGNEVTYTLIQKIQNDVKEQKEVVTQYSKTSWENDRRNVQALNEFIGKVLDPDGNLAEPIQQAIVGMFGTPSMYYDLDGISMAVNNGGDPNAFAMTGGRLIHRVFKIDGLGYIWNLSPFSVTGLDPLKSYYLAAKCSKTSLTGEWVLTENQIPTEGDVAYWYFNFGILSSVLEGVRSFRSTKGFTVISGGQIETDVITAYMINVQRLFAQQIIATDLFVTGSSRLAGFTVDGQGIRNENGEGFIVSKTGRSGGENSVTIGSKLINGDPGSGIGESYTSMVINNTTNLTNQINIGIDIVTSPSTIASDAIRATYGDIRLMNGAIIMGNQRGFTGEKNGVNYVGGICVD
ncbi:phage tail protein [Sphingobacterium faecium]|uniref:phage tail protein n=1 Tax=Sphingobacterium faecium TaxID=34087 RepID=UPI003DA2F7B4